MKLQTPAEGILKTNDWGDSKVYHVVCECGQPDHSHNLWIESEDVGINVTIYTTVKSPWWSTSRFRQIWNLLVKGYVDYETVLTMNKQTALNYAETLKLAIEDVEKFRNDRLNSKEKSVVKKLAEENDCI